VQFRKLDFAGASFLEIMFMRIPPEYLRNSDWYYACLVSANYKNYSRSAELC
jgi:hypothetical protein